MVKLYTRFILFTCIMTFSVNSGYATKMYNVLKFGAKPNGKADTTKAFLKSWKAACNTNGPAVIDVPKGRYVLKPLMFKGKKCISKNITLNIKGSIIAPKDHHVLGKVENWITFNEVTGVSIVGGVLDGRGPTWWRCKESGGNCLMGATSLRITYSNNISIRGLTSLNSQEFHIALTGCQNVHIEGVDIIASTDSPNTDGIHVQSSTHVTILDSTMRTGDDCISIGPGVKNVHIEGVLCGPGHGISIGSLGWEKKEAGVQNVTVKSVVISNTTNGQRIKSWARPSTGFVQDILYQNVTFRNVDNPIIVDQHYCPNNQCPRQESGVKVTDVTYKEIHGTSSTEVAMTFNCSTLSPCSGFKLENVNITFFDQEALSTCSNVKGQALGMVQPKSCFLSSKP